MAAFDLAVRMGCDWIETDLRLTADGAIVIIHDPRVDRTTDGKGKVDDFTLARLRRLEAGTWGGWKLRGERIPTLDEVLQWGRGRCGMNLEIKEESRVEELIRQLAARFKGPGLLDRILFSSFRASDLVRLRAALPHARLAWLASRHSRGLTPLHRKVRLAAMHPKVTLIDRRLAERCRRLGLAVHVWVVNQRQRLAELEALPVDGVMTDDPGVFAI